MVVIRSVLVDPKLNRGPELLWFHSRFRSKLLKILYTLKKKKIALYFSKFSLYRSKKVAWSSLEWPGEAWSGLEWPGAAWSGLERPWVALSGLEWPWVAWSGLERPGVAWSGLEWPWVALSGLEVPGLAWSGLEWPGVAWSGLEWPWIALLCVRFRARFRAGFTSDLLVISPN